MTDHTSNTIVLAAGGTGGHIFPAEALAEELTVRGYRVILMTDTRFKNYGGMLGELEVRVIRTGKLSGNLFKKLLGAANVMIGMMQARQHLKQLNPRAVIGFGGYPSFPTMFAANKMGIPTVIHEQNALMGRANRKLLNGVHAIATSYKETKHIPQSLLSKVSVTGNPVRNAVQSLSQVPYPSLSNEGILHLLVTGGSQGASVFSNVVPEAMRLLPNELKARIRIDQQCRKEDVEKTRTLYHELGMAVEIAPFFTDIPARLAAAHLVIARSGASTVAELLTAGRPAILVPYPHAADNHQLTNAKAIETIGGGWVVEEKVFTAEWLVEKLSGFMHSPATLGKASKYMHAHQSDHAAAALATLVEETIKNNIKTNTPERRDAKQSKYDASKQPPDVMEHAA